MLLAVIVDVSISILIKVRWMVVPSTFDGLTGAFILWHNESMAEWLFEHSWRQVCQFCKDRQDNAANDGCSTCFVRSSEWQWVVG